MTKKLKITLGSLLGLAGGAALIVGVGAGVCTAKHSNVSTSLKVSPYKDATNVASISATPVLSTDTNGEAKVISYTVTLDNAKPAHGEVWLVDQNGGLVKSLTVIPGQTVQVRVQADDGYTLGRLNVYGNDKSITLGTQQNGAQYTFSIPSDLGQSNSNGMPNPFQPGADNTIHVEATFVKDVLNGWSYNFNYKSYVLSVNSDDMVLTDANEDLNLTQFALKNDIGFDAAHPTNFIILLNGHTLNVNSFTIPSGCNVILLNNLNNTPTNGQSGTLVNADGAEAGFIVGGVLTTYQHITNNASVDGQTSR